MVSVPSGWVDAVSISFDVAPQGPSNDDFSSATVIGSYDFTDTVDADNATEWFDDPLCTYWRAQHTVWYRYTPPADARVHIDTFGSTMKGAIAVYKGSLGNLIERSPSATTSGRSRSSPSGRRAASLTALWSGRSPIRTGPDSFAFRSRLVSTLSLEASRDVLTYGASVRLIGHLKGFMGGSTPTVSNSTGAAARRPWCRVPSMDPVISLRGSSRRRTRRTKRGGAGMATMRKQEAPAPRSTCGSSFERNSFTTTERVAAITCSIARRTLSIS